MILGLDSEVVEVSSLSLVQKLSMCAGVATHRRYREKEETQTQEQVQTHLMRKLGQRQSTSVAEKTYFESVEEIQMCGKVI